MEENPTRHNPHRYSTVKCQDGSLSLADPVSGEPMHSSIGPMAEAELLYVEQTGLRELLRSERSTLRIWDVGLGIGANAIASLRCAESLGDASALLEIHSFEKHPEAIEQALSEPSLFPFLSAYRRAAEQLLVQSEWRSPNGRLRWRLHRGDFFETLDEAPAPRLIYYDFHSPKTCPELWTTEAFQRLAERARAPFLLSTYSSATSVRAAMLGAGLYVGYGRKTPAKNETTLASNRLELLSAPLGEVWLAKLDRSSKQPSPEQLAAIRKHPQFTSLRGAP